MYTAMTTRAGIDSWEAALQFGALGLYLGLSTGLAAMAWKALHRRHGHESSPLGLACSSVSFAMLITLAEWARSLAFGGFSSLSIGYAFADTWMRGYMPIGGVWCTSFAVLLSTALACGAFKGATRREQTASALAAIGIVAAGAGLTHVTWVQRSGPLLSYRLLQPNVAQDLKFNPAHVPQLLDEITRQLEAGPADIVLAPETAVPLFFSQLPAKQLEQWQAWSNANSSHLYLGMPMLSAAGVAHNALLHVDPSAQGLAAYYKVQLMPFGEYTPKGLEWTTRDLALPLKDMTPGPPDQGALQGPGSLAIGVLICQEEMVGERARRAAMQAGVILNPTNLAWFDESAALAQLLQVARARAMETGRPILRSANTGITAHIDHAGQLKTSATPHRQAVLSGYVQPMQGHTLYVTLGDLPFLALALAWLCISAAVTIRFRLAPALP